MENKQWLSFSLGPVQSFISTARTVRDLWIGSYLLSWLTAHAARAAHELKATFLEPDVTENPIFQFACSGGKKDIEQLLTPTLPNRFIAEIDAEYAERVSAEVEKIVRTKWREIADAVRSFLDKNTWETIEPNWDTHWDDQIENCWDIRVSVLPLSDDDVEIAQSLGFQSDKIASNGREFKARMFLLGQLDAAKKQIRHYPPHEPDDCHQPKCALCGERAQQGSRDKEKWGKMLSAAVERGERLSQKDHFCAVELVKRFAWAHYFSQRECFDCDPRERRVWDTYTIAASSWLAEKLSAQNGEGVRLDTWLNDQVEAAHREESTWNGQWLFWKRSDPQDRDKDEVDACPDAVWDRIRILRKTASEAPSSYYAVVVFDGDKMGEKLRNADRERRTEISRNLADFARLKVPRIIATDNRGQLIYAGGDDLLAMLPRDTALVCARELRQNFSEHLRGFTLSGGIAIVHVKCDLRNALDAARNAEKKAKNSSRSCLALSIVRRTGEAETAIVAWEHVPDLDNLRKEFAKPGVSDRFLYDLAAEWDTLAQEPSLLDIEFARLLRRSRSAPKEHARAFWDQIAKDTVEQRRNVLTLMQSASFLARARED